MGATSVQYYRVHYTWTVLLVYLYMYDKCTATDLTNNTEILDYDDNSICQIVQSYHFVCFHSYIQALIYNKQIDSCSICWQVLSFGGVQAQPQIVGGASQLQFRWQGDEYSEPCHTQWQLICHADNHSILLNTQPLKICWSDDWPDCSLNFLKPLKPPAEWYPCDKTSHILPLPPTPHPPLQLQEPNAVKFVAERTEPAQLTSTTHLKILAKLMQCSECISCSKTDGK